MPRLTVIWDDLGEDGAFEQFEVLKTMNGYAWDRVVIEVDPK